ncbi:MAG: hypothetical protein QXN15_10650 [Candidatus Jordarchaeales archaeon]|nr:hypothetical protein [Candidatus Jordarchaeia archaeon]
MFCLVAMPTICPALSGMLTLTPSHPTFISPVCSTIQSASPERWKK